MNSPLNYLYDASQHEPSSTPDPVPTDTYDYEITETNIEELADNKGHKFVVKSKVYTGPYAGRVVKRNFNLWNNNSAENTRISHNELSALCHCVGIFKVDMSNKGIALVGGKFKGRTISDGQYNEIKEFFDVNGNKPAKAGSGYQSAQTAPVAVATPSAAPVVQSGFPTAATPAPAAPAAPPPAAPVAPVFPPEGWLVHPSAPGYYYKGQEVKTEADLRAMVSPPAAPAVPNAPAAPVPGQPPFGGGTPVTAAAPVAAAAPGWSGQAAAPQAAPSWGNQPAA